MNKFEKVLNWISILALILLQFDFFHTNMLLYNIMTLILSCVFVGNIILSAISIKIIKKEDGSSHKIYSRYFMILFMTILLGVLFYIRFSM